MRERPVDRGRVILDSIYDDVDRRLNPDGDTCWNCGGDGETYECFDGFCHDAEFGCASCARPCVECRRFRTARAKAVHKEVIDLGDVDVAIAWLKRIDRWHDGITRDNVRQQLDELRASPPLPGPGQ